MCDDVMRADGAFEKLAGEVLGIEPVTGGKAITVGATEVNGGCGLDGRAGNRCAGC